MSQRDTIGVVNHVSLEMCLTQSLFKLVSEGNLHELRLTISSSPPGYREERDQNGSTLLHHAAAGNRTEVMKYLIDCGAELDSIDRDGNSPLHTAAIHGHIDALHLLLNSRANDQILNGRNDAPIHIIVRSNIPALVCAFLEHTQVDLLVQDNHRHTVIHMVAEYNLVESAQVILNSQRIIDCRNHGYHPSDADDSVSTVIHLAVRKGSHRVLDMIIEMYKKLGFTTGQLLSFLNEDNSTPLHAAVDAGHLEVVEVLLRHGASPLILIEEQPPPLHSACSLGWLDILKSMVEYCGKDILNNTDKQGRSPLHYSILSMKKGTDTIMYVVKEGAVEIDCVDCLGQTPLHTAILSGNLAGVNELLSRGADPLHRANDGSNALHFAVLQNHYAISRSLLCLECATELMTAANEDGNTPLHLAFKMNLRDLVTPMITCIKVGMQNITDAEGNTYLHLASLSGDWKTLNALLNIPICLSFLNETNELGKTPLHLAANSGHTQCVEVMLGQGAMVHKCRAGKTAFMAACSNGHTDCARLLFDAHPFQKDWKDIDGNTALHHAAQSGNPSMVILTLDMDIKISHNCQLNSFFDLLIEGGEEECAKAVVKHARWQECLDYTSSTRPHPVVGLIQRIPEVAKAVLDRCYSTSSLAKGHPDYWEKFDFKYLRMKDGNTSLSGMRNPNQTDISTHLLIKHKESIKCESSDHENITHMSGEGKPSGTMDTVQKIVQHKRIDLLIHPVVNMYIKSKWNTYGFPMYFLFFCLRFLLALFVSIFVVIVPGPSLLLEDNSTLASEMNSTNASDNSDTSRQLSTAAQVVRIIVLIINTILFLHIILPILHIKLKILNFVKNIALWIYGLAILSNFVFLLTPNPLDVWPAGALSCFFSWLMALISFGFFDVFGIYVRMFLTITRTVFQVLIICFFLILAFSFAFYVLSDLSGFSTIEYSFVTVFSYMLGEVQYELFVNKALTGDLLYSELVFLFVITAAILLSIVMANLLIGLAIGDIEQIKKNAILQKKEQLIEFFYLVDKIPILKRFDKRFQTKYPNKKVSLIRKIWRCVWRSAKGEETYEDEDIYSGMQTNSTITESKYDHKLDLIQERLEELTLAIKQLQDKSRVDCPHCLNE